MKSLILMLIALFSFNSTNANNIFIKNIGQYQSDILYYSQLNDINIFIKSDGVYFDFYQTNHSDSKITKTGHLIKMDFVDGELLKSFEGEKKGEVNYFIGNDKTKWVKNAPIYNEITINNIYDKIDFRIYFEENLPRYDFIVNVDGNPEEIKVKFHSIEEIELTPNSFKAQISVGEFINDGLFAFQNINGSKSQVGCQFIANEQNEISFKINNYDKSQKLIIDPIIYTSYLSWNGNEKSSIIKNLSKNRYIVAGTTESVNFPVNEGAYQEFVEENRNIFIAEYERNIVSHNFVRGTYLGGDAEDNITKLVNDNSGNIYLCGDTKSVTFPVLGGISNFNSGKQDGFIASLNSTLSELRYSYYVGGDDDDYITDLKFMNDKVYFAGYTFSGNLPIKNALQNNLLGSSDGLVGRSNQAGSSLDFLTYWGGSGEDKINAIDLNSVEDILWVGTTSSQDFPTSPINENTSKNGAGSDIVTGTFRNGLTESINSIHLGGSEDDFGVDIIHSSGTEYYILGYSQKEQTNTIETNDESFQEINAGGLDILVYKMRSTNISKATFIGGRNDDIPKSFKRYLPIGDFLLVGQTSSNDFPIITTDSEPINYGRNIDGFVCIVDKELDEIKYSSFIGGREDDIITGCDIFDDTNFSFIGNTNSTDFKLIGKSNKSTIQTEGSFLGFHNSGSILLQNPSGGVRYCMGFVLPILFTFNDIDDNDLFDIYLTNEELGVFQLLKENHNTTSYNWDIPLDLFPNSDYKILVAHKSGVFDESLQSFSIDPIPQIDNFTQTIGTLDPCIGETITFEVTTSKTTDPEFIWLKNNVQLVKNKNSEYTIENIDLSHSGKYKVTIEDQCQPNPTSDEIEILVQPNTQINEQSDNFNVEVGESITIFVNVEGADLEYQWYFENNLLAGRNENIIQIDNVSLSDQGLYFCEITGKCGDNVKSDDILVTVNTSSVKNEFIKNLYTNKNLLQFDLKSNSAEEIKIQILNIMGQIIFENNVFVNLGINQINIPIKLENGVYFINTINSDKLSTEKFIILE